MTGAGHYREAERLAEQAHHYTYGDGADPVTGHALAAEAQVHATLALAAPQSGQDPAADKLREIREVLAAFDWERDDRQYALERIERIAGGAQ